MDRPLTKKNPSFVTISSGGGGGGKRKIIRGYCSGWGRFGAKNWSFETAAVESRSMARGTLWGSLPLERQKGIVDPQSSLEGSLYVSGVRRPLEIAERMVRGRHRLEILNVSVRRAYRIHL